ncbi:hypothetical protein [Synechococcus sp. PCC 7336]|uniref:hypothetical protein n=1 Tax=Synechococcus sp. PCC 7336 TaxID=195250 RepID=UPI00034BF112|nr:hypothetical protein [Synechococcus sp. PCC 7336]
MQALKQAIDRILSFAIFAALASFAWFAVAVAGAFAGMSLGYDLWMQLWQPLFQPILGLIMAGALASGAWSWMRKQRDRFSQ